MARMTVEEIIEAARKLTRAEQIQLLHALIDMFAERQPIDPEEQRYEPPTGSDNR